MFRDHFEIEKTGEKPLQKSFYISYRAEQKSLHNTLHLSTKKQKCAQFKGTKSAYSEDRKRHESTHNIRLKKC